MEALARLRRGVDAADRRIVSPRGSARRDAAIDWFWALLSLAVALAMLASGGLGPAPADQRSLDAVGVLIAIGMSLPLLARRRAPAAVFVVVMASFAVFTTLRYPPDVTIGPAVALYTLARVSGRELPTRWAAGLAAGAFALLWTGGSIGRDELLFPEMVFTGLLWLALWMAGRASRLKAEHISSLEERASRAEEEARRERRLAAAEERTRIARDLHDSAGHSINVILMQAGAARLLRERDPEASERALRTIEEVAREQIGEIDRLVNALRATDRVDEGSLDESQLPGAVPRGPEAGRALLRRMRAVGLEVEEEWRGTPRRLGPSVGRATYRILQEALTNSLRHGTGAALVVFDFGDEAVEVTVENPVVAPGGSPNPAANGSGHGLTGMRERATLVGGRFEASREDSLFRVRAQLPYDPNYDPHAADCRGA